jgi:NodT family efflux transporter outer membrane factor (OMF) lipoprotein
MESSASSLTPELPDYKEWWKVFNDPVLDSLVEMAYAQNLTLRAAGVRVLEARESRAIAIGSFFPQLQQAQADYARTLISKNLYPGDVIDNATLGGVGRTYNVWEAGFDAMWELDFWGKFRRAIEAATADLNASIDSYDDVLVTLVAEVAATYVQICSFGERLAIARENVKIQKETLDLTQKRFRYGAVSELDVEQARANLTNTEALIPVFEIGLRQSQNALCILLGMPPKNLRDMLEEPRLIPSAPAEVAVGIPAELLSRRPDVRQAEREVAAQNARIGVAVSDLYPHVILKGSIGVEADDLSVLWQDLSLAGAVGPSIRWDILNYGRIVNRARLQNARTEELIAEYQNTILKAYAEAENAIVAYLRSQERVKFLAESVGAAKRSVDLSLIQYRDGVVDFIRVLNAETFLTRQQDDLVSSRESVARNLIALQKALGGGWKIRLGKGFVNEKTRKSIRSRFGWTTGWWPRLSRGWPFPPKPGTGSPAAVGAGRVSVAGDEGGPYIPPVMDNLDDIVFQKVPVRVSPSKWDQGGEK